MNAPGELFYFKLSPEWWITAVSNAGLDHEGQGILFRLICLQWMSEGIPDDRAEIMRRIGQCNPVALESALKFFVHKQRVKGILYWPLIESWRHQAILKHEKLSAAGKKGIKAKAHKKMASFYAEENAKVLPLQRNLSQA